MIDRPQALEQICQLLRDRLRVQGELGPDTHLLQDLRLDSIQQLTLVVELENHFCICFDAGDEQGLSTLADLARLVSERAHG